MTVGSRAAFAALPLALFGALVSSASAQVSHGGVPPSTWAGLTLPVEVLKLPDVAPPPQPFARRPGEPLRYGEVVEVGLSADEFGTSSKPGPGYLCSVQPSGQ